jgi:hypothetical protein
LDKAFFVPTCPESPAAKGDGQQKTPDVRCPGQVLLNLGLLSQCSGHARSKNAEKKNNKPNHCICNTADYTSHNQATKNNVAVNLASFAHAEDSH